MTLKKLFAKGLIGLAVVLMAAAVPQTAEAINVRLKNPYPHTLWAAIVYFEDQAGSWVTRGWYKVEPRTYRTLNFSSSTKRNVVYIHAYTSEASWGSSGEGVINRTVIKEPFKYYEGESCPAGNNRRQVKFNKWYVENDGVVYWTP